MRKKLLVSFVLTMLLFVVVSPIHVSVGVVDFDSESGDFVAQSTVDWWPMFHHDLRHSGYSPSVVQEYIELLWSNTTGGDVSCSPAVVNGKVFVGSWDGYVYAFNATTGDQIGKSPEIGAVGFSSPAVAHGRVFVGSINRNVYALDEATLEIIWNFTTGGAISSSPAVDGNEVFVGSEDGKIYALDALTNEPNGTEKWSRTTSGSVLSSPAVSGGAVYVGSDSGYVYKFDTLKGHEIWRFLTADPVRSSPAVVDGKVFVGVNDGRVYALNATTGKYLWHFKTRGAVFSSPAVADGVVFVGSKGNRVYALDAADGRQIWNFTTGGAVTSSPAVVGDKVFVGSCDNKIYGLNVTDPNGDGIISPEEIIWNFTTDGPVESSPAIAEGKVFVGSLDNKVYAFAANKPPQASFNFNPISPIVAQMVIFNASDSYDLDGNITSYAWSFGDGTQVTETDPITTHTYNVAGTYNVTLTLRDDFKPVGTNTTWRQITVREAWPMFRHDPTHVGNSTSPAPVANETLWPPQTIGEVSTSSPAVMDTAVFIGSTNGTLYALNATDGTVTWKRSLGDAIHSSPAVVDNMVFIASENGTISVWDVNGNFLWTNHTQAKIYSSPTVSGNSVFIGSQDGIYAFDKLNGTQLWATDLGGAVDSSPAVASGRVFVGSWNGTVYAIDETSGGIIESYVIGAQIRIKSSPAVAYGKVFVGAGNGSFYALNTDCEFQWQKPTGGPICSSPAVAHGRVFVGSSDGKVYAFNVTNGEELWNETIGSVVWSSPAVAEGKVFVGSTNGIYALYEETGDIVWNYQTDGEVDSSPAILDDTLYVGSKDGKIYAFRSEVHNIAVIEVIPSDSEPWVAQNRTKIINATLWNKGTFNEADVSITASYNSTVFNITSISVTRSEKPTIQIPWNTTNIPAGNYVICVNASVEHDINPSDNNKTCQIKVVTGVHDINITDVKPSCPGIDPTKPIPLKNIVGQGFCVTIYVTVINEGNFTEEDIQVTVYWSNSTLSNQLIGSATIPELLKNAHETVNITWNTIGIAKGNYTITAYATPVPGETDTTDNTFIDGTVLVTIPGDVNGDGKVRVDDVLAVALAFGSNCGDPEYEANLDINCDRKIRVDDVLIAALNFGQGP